MEQSVVNKVSNEKSDNIYPVVYNHLPKSQALTLDVSNKNVIMFMSDDSWQYNVEKAKVNLEIVASAKHGLLIYAEDIDFENGDIEELQSRFASPNIYQMKQIDYFLRKYPDDELLAVCDAGLSRSGFVHWYLDVKSRNADGMTRIDNHFINHKHRYVTNAEFTKLSMQFMNIDDLKFIDSIPIEK